VAPAIVRQAGATQASVACAVGRDRLSATWEGSVWVSVGGIRHRGGLLHVPRTAHWKHLASYGRMPYTRLMAREQAKGASRGVRSGVRKAGARTVRTARLEARVAGDVHSTLKRAAELQGRSLSDFVVSAAHDAACRAIEEAELIRLAVEDQRQLAKAIFEPPAPAKALRRAFRRRRELLGK
jgi:uncharacterized protein (DUF1778 family)